MGKFRDITGQKFGRLTAKYYDNNYITKSGKKCRVWWCECDCGNPNLVPVTLHNLIDEITKSCGCYHQEQTVINNKKYKKKYNTYDLTGEHGIGYTMKGEEFYFDLEDYDKIKDYCWHIHNRGYVSCSINKGKDKPKKDLMMHTLIMNGYDEELNVKNNMEVDHINGSSSRNDNRKENLRTCTHQENMCNYGMPSNNTSGIIGVSWDNTYNYWVAYITYQGKRIMLGRFANKEDAIIARLKAEKKYFKEFANQKHLFEIYDIDNKPNPIPIRKISKTEKVLNYLLDNKSINTKEAVELLGETRLAGVIFKLKNRGMDIASEYISEVDESGQRHIITSYALKQ